MQSVIMIADKGTMLDKIADFCNYNKISYFRNGNQLNIEMENGRVYISLSDEIVKDYDDKELEIIGKIFSCKVFYYLICFSNKVVCKDIMQVLTYLGKLYIDDDCNHIESLSGFIERLA